MKIMLLSLPGLEECDGNLFPLGIGYLVAAIKQRHQVQAYHFASMEQARREIGEQLQRFQPTMVGLTCSTFNRGFVKEIISLVKQADSRIQIVVGGVHASFCYDHLLDHYHADFVVMGEGERTLAELCDIVEQHGDLTAVRGLAFKEGGAIVVNQPREVLQHLDELEPPDFTYAESLIRSSGMGFVITSRGCPVRCTFCSTSSFWGQKVRMHTVKRVVDDMEALVERYNVRRIFFHDDTFNLGIPRVKELCAEIMRRGIRVEWGCSCRVSPVSEEMISVMVDAGCRHICWGIESGSEVMLSKIGKKISLDQIRNAYELSSRFSQVMSTGAFTMVGNPGETEETIKDTVAFLNTVPITDRPSTSKLYILPGTLLYERLREAGDIRDEDWCRHESVPFYTMENSFRTLARWASMVSASGKRIPFDPKRHFWSFNDEITGKTSRAGISLLADKVVKVLRKPEKFVFYLKSFLPAGKIRF